MALLRCTRCHAFLAAHVETCPKCATPAPSRGILSRFGLAGGVLGGGAVAFTLVACYGAPPCEDCVLPLPDAGDTDAGGDAASLTHDAGTDAAIQLDAGIDAASDADIDAGGETPDAGGPDAQTADAQVALDAGDASD